LRLIFNFHHQYSRETQNKNSPGMNICITLYRSMQAQCSKKWM
jgi:hypothetical protein